MKILYDYQIFTLQKYGGISRYFVELLKQLSLKDDLEIDFPLYFSNNVHIKNADFSKHRTFLPNLRLGIKNKYTRYLNKKNRMISIQKIADKKFDLFHPTYYDPYFLNYIEEKPFVLTVHDLTSEIFPEFFPKTDIDHKKKVIEQASKIIAISKNTKSDLIKIYDTNPEKITVIPLSVSFQDEQKAIRSKYFNSLPGNYLLFVGNRKVYKNFMIVLESMELVTKAKADITLICAGGGHFTKKERHLINMLGLKKKVFYFPVNDSILKYLYSNALAFIFPSLYEGFGIPILEAFECSCPVLLSNASSFPEVAGDAGLYFDPRSPQEISDSILRISSNEELRNDLILKGKEKLKEYSWEKTASMTKKLYESI